VTRRAAGSGTTGEPLRVVIYWRPGTAAMAPHAALAEIGVDYRLVEIGREEEQEDADYRALNALGLVPTLLDEEQGLVLAESAAILLYLGDRFPSRSSLRPSAPTTTAGSFSSRTPFRPPCFAGSIPSATAAATPWRADIVERSLEGRTWLAADHRTGADLFLFMLTRWGRQLEPAAWDRRNLRRHFLATVELPGVHRMLDEQRLEIPSL
jgi:glutathione S-transferase